MQYQHEEMNRWGVPLQSVQPSTNNTSINTISTSNTLASSSPSNISVSKPVVTSTSSTLISGSGETISINSNDSGNNVITNLNNSSSRSPTDSENNNQPSNKNQQTNYIHQPGKLNSPLNINSTVSAAADSSDNQPSTPQPPNGPSSGINTQIYSSTNSLYLPQDMHPYPGYMHGYDQFYHPPPGMEYSQSSLYVGNQVPTSVAPHQEYKLVPSSRYHPYLNSNTGNNNNSNHLQQLSHNTGVSNGNNTSSSISNSSLSPRIVSSSSPTQNAILSQGNQDTAISQINTGQPTPSPSPKQCDKCGMICQTNIQLSEHYTTVHGVQPPSEVLSRSTGGAPEENVLGQTHYPYNPYVKDEPGSDILDLDSQKMVYPPHDAINQEQPLPPMHSMHPMHRPIIWGTEMHSSYTPHSQADSKQPFYSAIKQSYPTIKQEYPPIKQEYPPGSGFGSQIIKSEYNQPISQTNRAEVNKFQTDISSANPVSSSPSEFPSTTTPQDNGSQFRGFEPPSSSLPSNTVAAKSTTWKSNEARRPKTYNCTACNKWFTSSGHLKRHYNTTLHKNAVKSSGQPDPATMPISAHHHPSRDPNSKHNRNNQQSRQPAPAPPEPPRSPEYTPQYTPPPGGFSQTSQAFQYSSSLHSTANGHPNGQAGPSVHASQPRGLLIISTTEAVTASTNLEQEEQVQLSQQQEQQREEQYHQLILEQASHLNLETQQLQLQQQQPQQVHIISMSPHQHRQDIISTIPTTIPNSMDHQRYIISPLAINTTTHTNTIPSFQHLQHQVEHLPSYHTIIGNDTHLINGSSDNLLQMTPFDLNSQTAHEQIQMGTSITTIPLHQIQTSGNEHHMTSIAALGNSLVEVHRISSGGVASNQDSTNSFSPVVPESLIRCIPLKCERSPQEADVAPPQSSGCQPSFPYSPTISSTVTSSTSLTSSTSSLSSTTVIPAHQEVKKQATKRKRSGTTKSVKVENQSSVTTTEILEAPPKIECVECGKEFAKSCYLTQHNKTFHSGEQPFRCQKCGKRFQNQQIYDIHLDKHKAQDKPFKCDKCPKQFHHKTDLRRHRDGHTGYKAHVCDTCSKGFCRKDHLRKHSDTHKPKPNKVANRNAAAKIIIKKEVEA